MEIVTYAFSNPKLTYTQLAEVFNVSVQRISQIMNSTKVISAFPLLAQRKRTALVPKAMGRLEDLMDQNVNLGVAEKVVSRILDSEKVLEPETRRVIHELQSKSTEELLELIHSAQALPKQAIDAEIVSEPQTPNEAA